MSFDKLFDDWDDNDWDDVDDIFTRSYVDDDSPLEPREHSYTTTEMPRKRSRQQQQPRKRRKALPLEESERNKKRVEITNALRKKWFDAKRFEHNLELILIRNMIAMKKQGYTNLAQRAQAKKGLDQMKKDGEIERLGQRAKELYDPKNTKPALDVMRRRDILKNSKVEYDKKDMDEMRATAHQIKDLEKKFKDTQERFENEFLDTVRQLEEIAYRKAYETEAADKHWHSMHDGDAATNYATATTEVIEGVLTYVKRDSTMLHESLSQKIFENRIAHLKELRRRRNNQGYDAGKRELMWPEDNSQLDWLIDLQTNHYHKALYILRQLLDINTASVRPTSNPSFLPFWFQLPEPLRNELVTTKLNPMQRRELFRLIPSMKHATRTRQLPVSAPPAPALPAPALPAPPAPPTPLADSAPHPKILEL